MSHVEALSGGPPTNRTRSFRPERLFYTVAAALMLALAFIGFSRFYLHGRAYPNREIAAPIRALVIAHGVAMTGWLLLLLAQPLLILRRSHRVHMTLGRAGAVLAALILVLGLWLAIRSAAVTPPEARIWGLPPRQFMAVPFISALIFAAFVALGVIYRRKPRIHRPMMLLATLSAMSAAVSRIDPLNDLYLGTAWERHFGPFFLTLVIGVLLLAVRCALTRSFDRWFAMGLAALIVASAGIMHLATTDAWASFTSMLLG